MTTPLLSASFSHAVTGGILQRQHVDGGLQLGLPDALGRRWFGCNARGFVDTHSFDVVHRLVSTGISRRGSPGATVASRVAYGDGMSLEDAQALNLRGRTWQSFSQDGYLDVQGVTLAGEPCAAVRYLSLDYAGSDDGMPVVDVPPLSDGVPEQAGLQSQGYSAALQRYDAFGRGLEAVDLQGNQLRSAYLPSGLPDTVSANGTRCLGVFTQNARGQILSLAKGTDNGDAGSTLFTAAFRYDPRTWQATQRYASTSTPAAGAARASGGGWIDGSDDPGRLQDMRYVFDPAGNVLALQDAYPATVFREDRVAVSTYAYDALYRLLRANGMQCPAASPVDGSPGNKLNQAIGFDAGSSLVPYQQFYMHDDGGNITSLIHYCNGMLSSACSADMKVSSGSNRSISGAYYQILGGTGDGTYIDDAFFLQQGLFDACGNQLKNANLGAITWDYRNQITRTSYPSPDDEEATVIEYSVHNADGSARSRKVSITTDARGLVTRLTTVTCLGDAERRTSYTQSDPDVGIGYDGETVSNANVQCDYQELRISLGHAQQLRIQSGILQAGGAPVTRSFYTLGDRIDSCLTELDDSGDVDSCQIFYPYGGLAVSAADDLSAQGGLATKTRQYSGEERDDSGLAFYGFRSYMPDMMRWPNPDPSEFQGSRLNWYQMTGGNPLTYRDKMGLMWEDFPWQAPDYQEPPLQRPVTRKTNKPREGTSAVEEKGVRRQPVPLNLLRDGKEVDLGRILAQVPDVKTRVILMNWAWGDVRHNFESDEGYRAVEIMWHAATSMQRFPEQVPDIFQAKYLVFATTIPDTLPTLYFMNGDKSARVRQQHSCGPAIDMETGNRDFFFQEKKNLHAFMEQVSRQPKQFPDVRAFGGQLRAEHGFFHGDVTWENNVVTACHTSRGTVDLNIVKKMQDRQIARIYLQAIGRST
ncbi:MAG TPA: RHS repeat-associated core domain-containing protein [Noviherbaspirillum sp.]|uniref:RHS repeat-associated core domain-containing protein n=1 Tax=Noviherbaspirillum sp. TaxID=1926288 RepID=UPI002D693567|nr:RHS repeat-associated core domain-containing protein [Noviherbaspirillum sp.]HYD94493.1 RHS repeat-associated core domain-containing protein [Noviherbaspirillum sp.]